MRQIVLDTETTGLEAERGHRIIEIGCIEMMNRRCTGRVLHHYLDPERDIDPEAQKVHGISREQLAGKPRFAAVAGELLQFIAGAELIIHNAAFDVAFLDREFGALEGALRVRTIEQCRVLDTLLLARELHPGQRNSLDALCKRYRVDNSHRELHGALLDARLLADVYLAMTGGQGALELGDHASAAHSPPAHEPAGLQGKLRVQSASPEELESHAALRAVVAKASGGHCLWDLSD
jgi:DNA polymerase III subunit epsilon